MRIGILGAMNEEIALLQEIMVVKSIKELAGRIFYIGSINNIETVLVLAKVGKVAAAITTTLLIQEFAVDAILFTGLAGAVALDLNIGDIVVSNTLVQHDLDASPIFPQYEIPLLGISSVDASQILNQQLRTAIQHFLQNSFHQNIEPKMLSSLGITEPKLHFGTIASGDQFVKEAAITHKIRTDFTDAKCVEMEGAAVAQVCYEWGLPFSVVRIISDKADHSADIDFPKFLEVASIYSREIINSLLQSNLSLK
ncbi:MAG: 5'-methylthioadenosine/adenosylhomocysteine nucleosidase [Gammaproteobacteria bacterium]|jgi:adenosylhomocysteine nucleosidase